jgi:hypothetical protein
MATAPIVDKQASRSAPSGLSLGDDEQEHRSRRLLLDGSSSVRRLARTRRWLLSWTIRSSAARGPQLRNRAIALRHTQQCCLARSRHELARSIPPVVLLGGSSETASEARAAKRCLDRATRSEYCRPRRKGESREASPDTHSACGRGCYRRYCAERSNRSGAQRERVLGSVRLVLRPSRQPRVPQLRRGGQRIRPAAGTIGNDRRAVLQGDRLRRGLNRQRRRRERYCSRSTERAGELGEDRHVGAQPRKSVAPPRPNPSFRPLRRSHGAGRHGVLQGRRPADSTARQLVSPRVLPGDSSSQTMPRRSVHPAVAERPLAFLVAEGR